MLRECGLTMTGASASYLSCKETLPIKFSGKSPPKLNAPFLSFNKLRTPRQSLAIRASSDRGINAGTFLSGLLLGGIVGGTLSCVYAPQISKALMGVGRNKSMKKLPDSGKKNEPGFSNGGAKVVEQETEDTASNNDGRLVSP